MTGADTRQHILDTALVLMADAGFTAMSMRQLASVCETNVAIIYRHFASKEAILEAVVSERRVRVFDGPAPVGPGKDVEATLTRLFVALLDRDPEYEQIYRIMFRGDARTNARVVELRDELFDAIEQAYKRWLVELFPSLAGRRDVGAIARTLRTIVQGAYGELVLVPGQERPKALRARARELARVLTPALRA